MPAAETTIMGALFAHLGTMPGLPPVAWPNLSFTPPADGKYLRVQFFPNVSERRFSPTASPHRLRGLMQVSVFWPQNAGEVLPREVAGAVAGHFAADTRLSKDGLSVRIPKRPDVMDLMIADSRAMIPVMIDWECWA